MTDNEMLALAAVQDYEKWIDDYEAAGIAADDDALYRRAQLRVWWALNENLRRVADALSVSSQAELAESVRIWASE